MEYSFPYGSLEYPYSVSLIRRHYFNGKIDLSTACHLLDVKRSYASFIVFSYKDGDGSDKYFKCKCAFRGNDVYRSRVYNRHRDLLNFCNLNKDIPFVIKGKSGYSCSALKFTLTVDVKRFNLIEFNSVGCSFYYDLFIKQLRRFYSSVTVARSYEVFKSGFLHVNVIALFPNSVFSVYCHKSKKNFDSSGLGLMSWRLKDYSLKRQFNSFWSCGFVDTRCIVNCHDLAEYSLKYHIKNFISKRHHDMQMFTMSVLSLFNKRAFSFPKESVKRGVADFFTVVVEFVNNLENSTVNFPRLDTLEHNSSFVEREYVYEGSFVDFFGEYDSTEWFVSLDSLPLEVDSMNTYTVIQLNPFSVELCVFDSGFRLDSLGDGHYIVFSPKKYVSQISFKTGRQLIKRKRKVLPVSDGVNEVLI